MILSKTQQNPCIILILGLEICPPCWILIYRSHAFPGSRFSALRRKCVFRWCLTNASLRRGGARLLLSNPSNLAATRGIASGHRRIYKIITCLVSELGRVAPLEPVPHLSSFSPGQNPRPCKQPTLHQHKAVMRVSTPTLHRSELSLLGYS